MYDHNPHSFEHISILLDQFDMQQLRDLVLMQFFHIYIFILLYQWGWRIMSHEDHTWSWHICAENEKFLLEGAKNTSFLSKTNGWDGALIHILSLCDFSLFLSNILFGLPPLTISAEIRLKNDVWCSLYLIQILLYQVVDCYLSSACFLLLHTLGCSVSSMG